MGMHKSLTISGKLRRHRNVLTRVERLEALLKEGRWQEGQSVFGLPKVRSIMLKAKPKPKAADEAAAGTEAAAAPGAAPAAKGAAPAAGAKGAAKPAAAGAKGAAPAAGAKGAAKPAAKAEGGKKEKK